MRLRKKTLVTLSHYTVGLSLLAHISSNSAGSLLVTYGLPGATSSSPQFTAVQGTTVPFVYYVKNISGSTIFNLSFIPPIGVPTSVVSAPSSCTSLTGAGLAPNETCFLYLQMVAPPYVSSSTTYSVGPVTVCAGSSSCSSSASNQNITLTVVPDGVAFVTNDTANTVSIYDTTTLRTLTTITSGTLGAGCTPTQSALNPNGSFLYVPCSNSTQIFKIATTSPYTATAITSAAPHSFTGPQGIAFTPDGQRYFVTNTNLNSSTTGAIFVMNANTDTYISGLTGGPTQGPVGVGVANMPDGATGPVGLTAYVTYGAGGTRNYSLNPVADVYTKGTLTTSAGATFVNLNADASQLWTSDAGSNSTTNVNLIPSNSQVINQAGFCNQARTWIFNPQGLASDNSAYILCGNSSNRFVLRYIWTISGLTGTLTVSAQYGSLVTASAGNGCFYGAFNPYTNNKMWVLNQGAGTTTSVAIIDTNQWQIVASILGNSAWYVNFLP